MSNVDVGILLPACENVFPSSNSIGSLYKVYLTAPSACPFNAPSLNLTCFCFIWNFLVFINNSN